MTSRAISRSTSDPFLSTAAAASSRARVLASNRSTCSGSRSSTKSVYWLAWSNASKLNSLIRIGKKGRDSPSSKHSDLTEESLEAHNRRQEERAAFIFQRENVDDKNAKCSPYYKGLTDYSLIINREKHQYLPHQSSSPGRESHATTVATSSSISSFMLTKMQEWSSCFSSFKSSDKDEQYSAPVPVAAPPPPPTHPPVPAPYFAPPPPPIPASYTVAIDQDHPCCSTNSTAPKMPLKRKETDKDDDLLIINEEKPLRERVSISESKSPPPPEPLQPASNVDEKDETVIDMLVEREFTWADKYRPKTLEAFICNQSTAAKVQGLIKGIECNHFIFEGSPGVGKRTMIRAMIQEAYGPETVQTREESKAFRLRGESIGSIEVRIKVSSQHIEVNLSDMKGYEKHIVVELIKETDDKKSRNYLPKHDSCRAIILYNADRLSADAVLYIKWLLERYQGSSKFFFCCSDVSKLQAIKELCNLVQLFMPSNDEIVKVLKFIAKQEGIELPFQFAERIALESKNNLRQAIRSLEASWRRSYPFAEDQEILTGWEDDIANIAKNMIQEQSPKQLYIIRGKLQKLIEHDVSPEFIFNTLLDELKKHLDEFCQGQLDLLYKDYNRKDGNMLEAENQLRFPHSRHEEAEFIAKFMSLYKLHITTSKRMQYGR
ncbi:Replication factor C subunit, putative [Ricinus communis]|uniref:Replication factor C subunit, putative n=1 Tax=Ricinus communis TaxID=3988 RepID=B9T608_RICCO|nr:Replication factor C subunit, putative [Ricinus communis]